MTLKGLRICEEHAKECVKLLVDAMRKASNEELASEAVPRSAVPELLYCLAALTFFVRECDSLHITNKWQGFRLPLASHPCQVQNVRDAIRSYSTPKSSSNKLGEKADEEIDAGFDFIVLDALCSSSEMQQLRWMTKTLNNPQSPIFNWSGALVETALRNLSQDESPAKKDMDWPIPPTPTYYHDWVLELLEKVWDFDTSALLMLGEAGAGKSPLGRSILLAQGIPDCVVYATTNWQGEGTFGETFRLVGFRGNEEKFKDYLEDICELLRDQLQINILRRQHCDDMAGNGSSDSESTDSSDASDDTEDEDKGDKDASTPKRDGHGYGYPSGECSRSAVPTTALVPDVREIWEKMDAEALKKLLANKEEEMFKVAEESKRIKSIITKQESQKKKELKKQKDKEKREEKAKETQVSGKSTVKDIREAFASKAGISKAKAIQMAFYQGDDRSNDHPRRQVAGELKLRDGDTLVVRPTLSGGGVRQRINKKSDECKTYALDIAKDVQNKVKVKWQTEEAFNNLIKPLSEDMLKSALEFLKNGGSTEFKVKNLARVIYASGMKSLTDFDFAVSGVIDSAENSSIGAYYKATEENEKLSLSHVRSMSSPEDRHLSEKQRSEDNAFIDYQKPRARFVFVQGCLGKDCLG
ncbi:unnamed protein product [Symbiodinium microadriaticum]|nr:unnamed protein product [Symbiodinium sp. KB8]CAE7273423.1 unnamed protein product [Symbiodinium microadriaticum]